MQHVEKTIYPKERARGRLSVRTARKAERSRLAQLVLGYLRQARGSLCLAAVCMVGLTLTELLKPWPLKIIVDNILLGHPFPPYLSSVKALSGSGNLGPLIAASSAIFAIAFLMGLFTYLQVYLTSRVGNELVHVLRSGLFAHLQQLPLSFHKKTRSGELMTKVVSDTNTLKNVFTESVLTLVINVSVFTGMFVIMFFLDWRLGLVVFATLPLLAGTITYRYRKAKQSSKAQRRKEQDIATRITEVMSSVSLIKAFGREGYEQKRFENENSEYLKESIRNARIEAVASRSVTIIAAFGTAVVVFLGALQVLAGKMTPGELLVFTAYVQSMYKPLQSLAKLSTKLSKAKVSAERMGDILEVEPDIEDKPDAIEASDLRGEVVFKNVSFSYKEGLEGDVLKNVSFRVRPGQRVALVGASGTGKSTLVSLILRLYEPRSGSIYVDGLNIRDYRYRSLRHQIGVVQQGSVLFGTTIRENIAYGKLDASMDEVVTAARAANAHEFILGLEDGYETVLGERGDTLSGGQRQRIVLTRAIIRDAPILILDESMTGLDVESESRVQEALDRLTAGKTCFVITHDLRAAADADLVLFLKDGRIVEQGTPQELLAAGRHYSQLHELGLRA